MTAEQIREMQEETLRQPTSTNEVLLWLAEIALQLALLNEKFSDYFQSLEPTEIEIKRGIK